MSVLRSKEPPYIVEWYLRKLKSKALNNVPFIHRPNAKFQSRAAHGEVRKKLKIYIGGEKKILISSHFYFPLKISQERKKNVLKYQPKAIGSFRLHF